MPVKPSLPKILIKAIYLLGYWSISSAYKNLRGQKCSLRRKIHLGDSMLANKTFCLCTKVHRTFFLERGRKSCRSHFSDFRYLESFRRYSRSKSKVVKNRAECWTFFALPNFRGPVFQKLYPRYNRCIAARRLEKVL